MGNRGYISVFLALILSILLGLVVAIYTAVDLSCARGRSATAMRSAMSGVRAEYDRYLFEQYHVLFLNQNMDGEGTGGLEERVQERLGDNLGDSYEVDDVYLDGVTGVMDNNCNAFRSQVKDASIYLAADKGVDILKSKVNGNDRPVTEEEMNSLDMSRDEKPKKRKKETDPRNYTKAVNRVGVAYWILPEDTVFSTTEVDATKLPSRGKSGKKELAVDAKFNSISRLKSEATQTGGWLKSAEEEGAGLIYAANCFNCLTDQVQEDTVLNLEIEYLIAGKSTDTDNYKSVVNQIMAIRTACNFAYILTDRSKMSRLSALAWAITWFFPPLQPVVKYLLAGAWSYIEAVADAYRLVRGKKVPYLKRKDNWLTDLDSLSRLDELPEGDEDDENGLDYEDYLLILLAPRMNTAYYRMLDIMQLNANQNVGSDAGYFDLQDAVTELEMTAEITYEGHLLRVKEQIGY